MTVIANTTVISNFAIAHRLDLLQTCWGHLYIPDQVFGEIQNGLLQGYEHYASLSNFVYPLAQTGWMNLTALNAAEEFQLYGQLLSNRLHEGEAACLAIAFHRQWTFLSDDKTARQAGHKLQIPISGTIGILVSLVQRNLILLAEADAVLGTIIQAGFFSPVLSLAELL